MGESWLGTALGKGFALLLEGGCGDDDGQSGAGASSVTNGAGREKKCFTTSRAELRTCWLLRRRVVYFCKAVGAEVLLCDLN